jgi:hypothetical protein
MVFFTISNGHGGVYIFVHIFILYVAGSFMDDPSHVIIASPSANSRVVKSVDRQNTTYTLLTPTRQIALQTGVPSPFTDTEVVRILTSLPTQ